jgi:hypothetical protein
VIFEYLDGWAIEGRSQGSTKSKFLSNKSKVEGGKENV